MKIFNIDTLSVSGQGTLCVVEGPDTTPVPVYIGLPMQANVKILVDHLELTVRTSATLTGEIKRIIMLIHLMKRAENSNQLVDLVFQKDFSKNAYMMLYDRGISCKVLLGVSNNTVSLKTATVHTLIFKEHEIDKGIATYKAQIENLRIDMHRVNMTINNVFNNYC